MLFLLDAAADHAIGGLMMDKEKTARIMDVMVDNCQDCPFLEICNSGCAAMWQRFFNSKVTQKGKIKWEGRPEK